MWITDKSEDEILKNVIEVSHIFLDVEVHLTLKLTCKLKFQIINILNNLMVINNNF